MMRSHHSPLQIRTLNPIQEHAMKSKTLFYLIVLTLLASFSLAAHAQTFSVIHNFTGPDGAEPSSGVTIKNGVLYGTAGGTAQGRSIVYQMQHVGSSWGFTPISTFSAGGINPQARVVFGPDNLLYGTTSSGGQSNFGLVFNLTPPATICKTVNCLWSEKVLYQFTGNPPDGAQPGLGDLVWDAAGNIYGTTVQGGGIGYGTVYEMTKSGNNWTETPIYNFGQQPDGQSPYAGVILDSNGNLFGTTVYGGLYGYGTVFELKYVNGIGWSETVLHNFQNLSDGGYPLLA
jgi:uncharacterized repeat protein (TIGR03803 family)